MVYWNTVLKQLLLSWSARNYARPAESSAHIFPSIICRPRGLTWCACMAPASGLSDAAVRTRRPSTAAGWAAPHPCASRPASPAPLLSPKVSEPRHTPAAARARDARSAHGPRRKHSENPYMDAAVLNLTEEGGWKEFRLNLQILRVRWLGFALGALGWVWSWTHNTFFFFPAWWENGVFQQDAWCTGESDRCGGKHQTQTQTQTLTTESLIWTTWSEARGGWGGGEGPNCGPTSGLFRQRSWIIVKQSDMMASFSTFHTETGDDLIRLQPRHWPAASAAASYSHF